jgi:protein involved in polysaccharide export with SLBB domain
MRFLVILAGFFLLTACASAPDWPDDDHGAHDGAKAGAETDMTAEPGSDHAGVVDVTEDYRLGSGDKLRIIVFDEPSLSGEFLVDGTGAVSLPLIGEIEASGKTVRELQRDIELALKDGYLNDPKVSAEVLNFRPFYILGEVNIPGTYPYTDGLTVLNAVATAGGFTYRANERVVYIRRAGELKEQPYKMTSSTPVRPGDTVRIGERIF